MAATFTQVAPDSTGKKIAGQDFTRGAHTVIRQEVILGNATDDAALAAVTNADPAETVYGLPVRPLNPARVVTSTITATDVLVAAPSATGVPISGVPTAGSYVAAQVRGGDATWTLYVGTYASGTIHFEASSDSTNGVDGGWVGVAARHDGFAASNFSRTSATAPGRYVGTAAGYTWIRVRSVGGLSGSPTIRIILTASLQTIGINYALPPGTHNIGRISVQDPTNPANNAPVQTTAVTGTEPGLVTRPILPPTPAGSALIGKVNLTDAGGVNLAAVLNSVPAGSEYGAAVRPIVPPTSLCVTATAALNTATTLTLPAPGGGLFQYITRLELGLYATAARTGNATPLLVTTTNLPGSPVFNFETAQAIGTMIRYQLEFDAPLKASAANTAVTVVAPAATAGIWRLTAFYYNAP